MSSDKCLRSSVKMASSQMLLSSVNPVRPLAHFTPSLYGNIFTSSANHDQVKCMFTLRRFCSREIFIIFYLFAPEF